MNITLKQSSSNFDNYSGNVHTFFGIFDSKKVEI